jgi:hypothetical protein
VKTLGGILGLTVIWVLTLTVVGASRELTHPVVLASSPTPEGPKTTNGIWTPYDPHCQADCFPDLTPYWATKVDAYYQGSYEDANGNFKGLPPDPLKHYACEYLHIAGDSQGIQACKN